ncbi:MAG TPA: TssQ family T6SS-associated lipoprotein [Burkholderiales bacterium]|nr:TssQ family T6SS-associated lipoprotein [Burkholderiales bacterium]
MRRFLSLRIFFVWLALVCASCSLIPSKPPNTGETKAPAKSNSQLELENGIKSYEEGDYKSAAKQLQKSLELGLESKADQGSAHKYLAFIHCASGRDKACREEFRKGFDSDPQFDLQPSEAGHPIWGPVFRNIKAELAAKSKPKSSVITYSDYNVS